jgi:hypothetical protein
LHFFAVNLTTSLKIPGAVIPRKVFTQPGSKPEITAAQHWHPLQPDQQTLRVRTLYAQHVELAFNVAEYEIGARHHRGPPSPSVAFSAP